MAKKYQVRLLQSKVIEEVPCTPESVIGTIETDFGVETLLALVQYRNAELVLVDESDESVESDDSPSNPILSDGSAEEINQQVQEMIDSGEATVEPDAIIAPEQADAPDADSDLPTSTEPTIPPPPSTTLATFLADGLDEGTAKALLKNGLDVAGVKNLISEGFDLTELEDIGTSRAKKILEIYGPK